MAFELKRMRLAQGLGIAWKIAGALGFELSPVDDTKASEAARLNVAHEFERDPAHGVTRVDFDDGFEAV